MNKLVTLTLISGSLSLVSCSHTKSMSREIASATVICENAQNIDACYAQELEKIAKAIGGAPSKTTPHKCDSAQDVGACYAEEIEKISQALKSRNQE